MRRAGLSSSLASVFDLRPGAVFEPISQADGLYVFRLMSKRALSLQEATPEVTRNVQTQRLQQAPQQITASAKVTFDSSYFGVAANTASAVSSPDPAMNALPAAANSVGALARGPPATATQGAGSDRPRCAEVNAGAGV